MRGRLAVDVAPADVPLPEIAAMVLVDRRGNPTLKTNPRLICTSDDERIVRTWMRLTVVRGRRVGVFTAADLAECVTPNGSILSETA